MAQSGHYRFYTPPPQKCCLWEWLEWPNLTFIKNALVYVLVAVGPPRPQKLRGKFENVRERECVCVCVCVRERESE